MSEVDACSCPVCGWPHLHEPPYDEYDAPSYEICPSCGVEFGYDASRRDHDGLRAEWVVRGMPWWSTSRPAPPGWDPRAQLAALATRRI